MKIVKKLNENIAGLPLIQYIGLNYQKINFNFMLNLQTASGDVGRFYMLDNSGNKMITIDTEIANWGEYRLTGTINVMNGKTFITVEFKDYNNRGYEKTYTKEVNGVLDAIRLRVEKSNGIAGDFIMGTNYTIDVDYFKTNVAFIGDSIVNQLSDNLSIHLPDNRNVLNLGFPGQTALTIRQRMGSYPFYNELNYPERFIVMCGTNDEYYINRGEETIDQFRTNYNGLLDGVSSFKVPIVIVPILKIAKNGVNGESNPYKSNAIIDELNTIISEIANERGIPVINMNNYMSRNGYLLDAYSSDGLHLNAKGIEYYNVNISKELRKMEFLGD